MQPKIITRPAFTIVGMKWRGKPQGSELGKHWERFDPRSNEIQHVKHPGVFFGAVDHFDHEAGEFDYLAAREVESTNDVPDGMEAWTIPAQTYAVFPTTLPNVGQTMNHIYSEWLPSSSYNRTGGPEFEEYGESFDLQNPDSEFYVYIPVQEK